MNLLTKALSIGATAVTLLTSGLTTAAPHKDIAGLTFLVNRDYMISADYVPALREAEVKGQVRRMRSDAATALEEMFAAAKKEKKINMISVSGYRSYSKQKTLYQKKLRSVGGSKAKANQYVALPGSSEHQLGLAMDIGQANSGTGLTGSFGKTKAGKWLVDNAHRFGFILRYQAGWEEITGYNYEPWHVRYVGVEHATAMYEQKIPLEIYIQDLRKETLIAILKQE